MHKRIRMKNPFYINGTIPERYFCDRKQETARLVDYVQNQSDDAIEKEFPKVKHIMVHVNPAK